MIAGSQHFRGAGYLLYRGVHAGHPALAEAKRGAVVPGDIHGIVTPENHNRGGVSVTSPYTSWTRDRKVAEIHAQRHGPGGVILAFAVGGPQPDDEWCWEWSPDAYGGQEILLRGVRTGATVIAI